MIAGPAIAFASGRCVALVERRRPCSCRRCSMRDRSPAAPRVLPVARLESPARADPSRRRPRPRPPRRSAACLGTTKPIALAMRRFEVCAMIAASVAECDTTKRRIGAFIADSAALACTMHVARAATPCARISRACRRQPGYRARARAPAAAPRSSRASTACSRDRAQIGEAHAIGRQHAGQRMDEDARHAERIGDQAGMLAAGAAEAAERVVASRRSRAAIEICLIALAMFSTAIVRKPSAIVARRACVARSRRAISPRERREFLARRSRAIERLRRRSGRRHAERSPAASLPSMQIAVGDGQRPAAPIAGGPGIGAGRFAARRGSARRRSEQIEPPPAATVWICIIGARMPHAGDLRLEARARTRRRNATRRSRCRPCRSR